MTETLQEFVDSRGVTMRVDRQANVIRGVKILGLHSSNGRTYLPEALTQAARLYEGAKVNVNHSHGNPAAPRDYRDRLGVIRQVVVHPGKGMFADLHFNPKHELAEQLLWDAEHTPENVGLSHNVQATTQRRGDRVAVEAITRVQSVDLVADPATTRGLFESHVGERDTSSACQGDGSALPAGESGRSVETGDSPVLPEQASRESPGRFPATEELTVETLRRDYPELVTELLREKAEELRGLREEVERLTALEAVQQKRALIGDLLREFALPDPGSTDARDRSIVSERFVEMLLAAPSEQAMRELVEERAALLRCVGGHRAGGPSDARPLSRSQGFGQPIGELDAKRFVEAIT